MEDIVEKDMEDIVEKDMEDRELGEINSVVLKVSILQRRICWTLIEFLEEVTKQIDEGRVVNVIYRDFSKAFDKVPYGRLVSKRVVHVWNELPEKVEEAGTITTFKRHLDGYMSTKGLEGYGPNA
eukprot:g41771.t1